MTRQLVLELGQVSDPYARRALEQVVLQWPVAPTPAAIAWPPDEPIPAGYIELTTAPSRWISRLP